jgi:hypothetical protein
VITREDVEKFFANWQARGVMTSVKIDWESGKAEVVYDLHVLLAEANRMKQFYETEFPGWLRA